MMLLSTTRINPSSLIKLFIFIFVSENVKSQAFLANPRDVRDYYSHYNIMLDTSVVNYTLTGKDMCTCKQRCFVDPSCTAVSVVIGPNKEAKNLECHFATEYGLNDKMLTNSSVITYTMKDIPERKSECQFPFRYKGQVYYTCAQTENDELRTWCSTYSDPHNYNYMGQWKYCKNLWRNDGKCWTDTGKGKSNWLNFDGAQNIPAQCRPYMHMCCSTGGSCGGPEPTFCVNNLYEDYDYSVSKKIGLSASNGEAGASSTEAPFEAMSAFNAQPEVVNTVIGWHSGEVNVLPQVIWFRFNDPTVIVGYSFRSRQDQLDLSAGDGATKYEFFGTRSGVDCSDQSRWSILRTDYSGTPFNSENSPKIQEVDNNDAYTCYGFKILDVMGRSDGDKWVTVSNVEFYTAKGNEGLRDAYTPIIT